MNKDIKIFETRERVYERDLYQCRYKDCKIIGWDNLQLAHILSNSKKSRNEIKGYLIVNLKVTLNDKKLGEILNQEENLITSCSRHNQLFLIDNKKVERENHIKMLIELYMESAYE